MIISQDDLYKLKEEYEGKKIVYCTGAFDLTHLGHILFLDNCKKFGDILVVGLGKDALIEKQKDPSRPILNEKVRLRTVDSLKSVDYSFLIKNTEWKGKDTHKEMLDPVLKALKPDYFVINDEGGDLEERKRICNENGVEIVILPRDPPEEFKGVSTTEIIKKIKGDSSS
jgi:D-glycero-beta-D-manno-heptose 1-phosphate adenylyltransferase